MGRVKYLNGVVAFYCVNFIEIDTVFLNCNTFVEINPNYCAAEHFISLTPGDEIAILKM